ncbi:MAG TPA: Gfo/Idh/MocA family oxidoreductase [Roseiflexaceae bacterium]|nr:Gfo/Idh/MocA family oxidoreductase [Roseiflexaceae bacterium]HMP39130.1 Gfo/Idh/MocA family oxidoreductase [Roseiflexaceae bacterium]
MSHYRIGIIGCGRIASTMEDQSDVHPATIAGAFAALPNARIVAACNRGTAALHAFGTRWGVDALYTDYREMLAHEQLDIVAVATHPPQHVDLVVAAAHAGVRGIFCEKPLALSLAECDAMIEACRQNGTTLLVNCTRRWSGQYQAVKDLITAGDLGRLLHIVAHCEGCKPTPEWVAETEGPLLHDAVHTFDILRFFAGDITSIQGSATRRIRRDLRVEDTSYALVQFASGVDGVVITDELSEYARWDVELQCERGVVRLEWNTGLWHSEPDPFEAGTWWRLVPGELPAPAWSEPSIQYAARDLIESLEQGREPRCSGSDGRAAVEAIMAVYESQRRGGVRVDLPVGVGEPMLEVLRREGVL